MNKKYLAFLSLSATALALGAVLSGCSLAPIDSQEGRVDESPLTADQAAPAEDGAAIPEGVAEQAITDAEVDQELKDLDASMDTVKTTGFEAANLADKDLGL